VDIYVSFSLIAIHFWVCLKCVHVEGADMHARVWTSFWQEKETSSEEA